MVPEQWNTWKIRYYPAERLKRSSWDVSHPPLWDIYKRGVYVAFNWCLPIHPSHSFISLSLSLFFFYMKYSLSTFVFALSTAGLAAAQASAGAFYITAPLEGDTWTAGTTYVVMKLLSKQILILFSTFLLAVKQLVRIAPTATRASIDD